MPIGGAGEYAFLFLCSRILCIHLIFWCAQCVHSITQLTGSTVIIAEFIVATEWTRKSNPLPFSSSWLAQRTHSLFTIGSQHQPLPSHWSSWGCCLVTSEAHIFEKGSGCLLQHFNRRSETATYTHSHSKAHTHSEDTTECTQATHWLSCSTCWYWRWHLRVLNWDNLPTGSKRRNIGRLRDQR